MAREVYGRVNMQTWHQGPINTPEGSPRPVTMGNFGGLSPRSTMRGDQLKDLYLTSAVGLGRGAGSAAAWDTFVAKQNSRAIDTLSNYSKGNGGSSPRSPRSQAGNISPRAHGTMSPRLMPGRTLGESLGNILPPLSPRDRAAEMNSPRHKRFHHITLYDAIRPGAIKGSIDAETQRRIREQERRKRSMSKLERRIIGDTENALSSRFGDMWSAFKDVDVDASGKISKEEIMKALRNWNVTGQNASTAEEAEAVIKMCDADGDGCITYEEFVDGLANHKDMKTEKFGSYERGSKGSRDLKGDPLRDPLSKLRPGVSADELVACHAAIRERLLTKHDTIHKAFKYMDADGSGFINRSEFEQGLRLLNISVRQPVLDTLLDIIDAEDNDDGGNDHDIGFKEFARVMQASDVFKMSALAPRPQEVNPMLSAREEARKAALKYLRPGVSQEELRKFQEQVKTKISSKYGKHSFSSAFKWIDADRTGSITREEFKEALHKLNLAGVKEAILDTLCDFIDTSGDGSFGYREFSRVISAEDVMQMIPGGASGID